MLGELAVVILKLLKRIFKVRRQILSSRPETSSFEMKVRFSPVDNVFSGLWAIGGRSNKCHSNGSKTKWNDFSLVQKLNQDPTQKV